MGNNQTNAFSVSIAAGAASGSAPGMEETMQPTAPSFTKVVQIGGAFDQCKEDLCDVDVQEQVAEAICRMETKTVPPYLTVGAFTPDNFDFPSGALNAARVRDEMHHLAASSALPDKFSAVQIDSAGKVWMCAVYTTEPNTLIAGVALTLKAAFAIMAPAGISISQKGTVLDPNGNPMAVVAPRSRFSDRLLIRGGDSTPGPANAPAIGQLSMEWTGLSGMIIVPSFDFQPGNASLPTFELGQLPPLQNVLALSYFASAGATLTAPCFGCSWIVQSDVALSGITVRPLAKQNAAGLRRLPELMRDGSARAMFGNQVG